MASVVSIGRGRLSLRRHRERKVRLAGIEFPRPVLIGVGSFFVLAILFAGATLAFIPPLADDVAPLLLLVMLVGIFKIALASLLFLTLAQEDRYPGRGAGPAPRMLPAVGSTGKWPAKTDLALGRGAHWSDHRRVHQGMQVRFLWLVRSRRDAPNGQS